MVICKFGRLTYIYIYIVNVPPHPATHQIMAPKTTTTASASSSTSRNSSRITRNSNSNSTQNMAQVSSQMMNSNEYTDAYSGLVYQADAMAAVAYTMAPSYAYNAFADTTGMGMYIGDNSSYINTVCPFLFSLCKYFWSIK